MKKVLSWIDEYLEEVLLAAALAAMAVIMGVQVFCRYVLGASLSWSEELTRYIFIWAGFLSVSYCTKKCISIKIEQFVALFPRRGKAVFKVVNHTFELILFVYLLPFAWKYLMSAVENGQTSPAMGIPMYLVQAAPLAGFALSAIRVLQRWIAEFKAVIGKGEN
ncbi:MAG TPA: TRAP transporter small permease [Candidatus Mediterraneibacter intestinipullorum]|nr:TRAP transporter small permease [Candidatus Mediterraneibacter intestinipullorum]